MTVRICLRIVIVAAMAASPLRAQQSGGTITGIVRDSASRPVADADVVARPGNHRTRTDSAGRFTLTNLDPDNYSVRARKLGYAPESWDVKLAKATRQDISIVLEHRMPVLDTVTVLAQRECPQLSIEAFICRRHRANGTFLDYNDIDDKEVTYAGELFRDMPGFRVDFRVTSNGPTYTVKTSRSSGCINSLIDGRPMTGANRIPELSSALIALEVYTRPDSVPAELERYTWPNGNVGASGRCTVVVYWTDRMMHGSVRP